jgi:hypothetical protein
MPSEPRPSLISSQSFRTLWRALTLPDVKQTAEESASTLFRFFRSKHVVDLQLIFTFAVLPLLYYILIVLFVGLPSALHHVGAISTGDSLSELFTTLTPYKGPIVAACGGIIAWAYRSASTRLGVVDLFACEISTLCRVGTIFDLGEHYVDQYHTPPAEKPDVVVKQPAGSNSFVSQEEYFPVFDHNANDLQLLEATVVNHITEFYTYMKALRDCLRKLAVTDPPQAGKSNSEAPGAQIEPDPWHAGMSNVIYMLFLAYESGRKAVEDLIEFEPTAAENTIVILLTELKCYSFLHTHFAPDDVRHARLKLREVDYKQELPSLYGRVMSPDGKNEKDWLQAKRTAPELANRYRETFGEEIDTAVPLVPGSSTQCIASQNQVSLAR